MFAITSVDELVNTVKKVKAEGKSIGLVPTMGALHEGHLSLIQRARKENDIVIVSIFVNPVQFNNPEDLQKYPRTPEKDLDFIRAYADYAFMPEAEEVFPEKPTEEYHFGTVEQVMEGAARPGHFNGVGIIVRRLLDWTCPDRAYFGEKDYQQIAVIRELVRQCGIGAQIVPCPIVREANGLAMSSRNKRLTAEQFDTAANIYRILKASREQKDVPQIKAFVAQEIAKIPEFTLEYFEVADDRTLQPVQTLNDAPGIMGFITVHIGGVRLIDNIRYR